MTDWIKRLEDTWRGETSTWCIDELLALVKAAEFADFHLNRAPDIAIERGSSVHMFISRALTALREKVATEIMGYRKDEHGNYSEWAEAQDGK